MKTLTHPTCRRLLTALAALTSSVSLFATPPAISPKDAAELVKAGRAILVDVRESSEWRRTGVAVPAVLLAKSDFDGKRAKWAPFLKSVGSRKIIVYCRSGMRARAVAEALRKAGYDAENAGSLAAWREAGLPIRKVEPARDGH